MILLHQPNWLLAIACVCVRARTHVTVCVLCDFCCCCWVTAFIAHIYSHSVAKIELLKRKIETQKTHERTMRKKNNHQHNVFGADFCVVANRCRLLSKRTGSTLV